jgi:hypothetical protein
MGLVNSSIRASSTDKVVNKGKKLKEKPEWID